ncbi:MAG: glycoside hydrolase family 76 protein [Trebonia sp.]
MTEPDDQARAAAAARALQRWYVRRTGEWRTTGWWNSANALTAVIGYTRHTGDRSHERVVETTFRHAGRRHPGFVNMFFDDNGWWGLAWVAAYDLTGDARYLDAARAIFAHNLGGWDGVCGGGLWWNTKRTYKNAITNELFVTLAAQLHQRTHADREYLSWALRGWQWLTARALIGPGGLVNDGLSADCANNGGTAWTYNQGVLLGGLAVLHDITGDGDYLKHGEFIADAALRGLTSPRGILTEPCEPAAGSAGPAGCNGDQTQFKGIFARYLHEFYLRSGKPAYREFLLANAGSVWDNARNSDDQFGLSWGGPFDQADASRQSSALEVLTAAAALTSGPHPGPSPGA